jgi:hypothetical protein
MTLRMSQIRGVGERGEAVREKCGAVQGRIRKCDSEGTQAGEPPVNTDKHG